MRFVAAFRELAKGGIAARILAVGLVTGSNQLYMAVFGLLIVKEIGGATPDVGRFHGAIALLEIPFMLMCGLALRHVSKPGLIAIGGVVYAGFLFLFASMTSMAVTYALAVPAAFGAGIILSVSISYLQDLMSARPGAGAALMAVSNFVGQMVAAMTFAIGTAINELCRNGRARRDAGIDRRERASRDGRLAQGDARRGVSYSPACFSAGSSSEWRWISGICDMVKRMASGVKPQTLKATQKSVEKLRQMISLTAAMARK